MSAILTIAHTCYLVKSEAAAMAAMKALADAVEVGQSYDRKTYEDIYFPRKDRRGAKVQLTIIQPGQLRRHDPRDTEAEAEAEAAPPKQLAYNGPVHFTGDKEGE